MAIVGRIPDIQKHFPENPYFDIAFKYFRIALNQNSDIYKRIQLLPLNAFERVDLGKGIFALEQKFNSKCRSDCFLESHIKYIDIQLIISGAELMEYCDIKKCDVKEKYNAQKDLIVYEDFHEMNKVILKNGDFAIYFPQDIHLGCQMYKEPTLCSKTVIKMPIKHF